MQHNRIILIGPMGAGKTSVGLRLADSLHLKFLDSDIILAQQLNANVSEILAQHGEIYFRLQESLLIQELLKQENIVLATGGGSILDPKVREKVWGNGLICFLNVSPQIQVNRVQRCCHRPSVPEDLEQRLNFFINMMINRYKLYKYMADFIVDTDKLDIDNVAERIIQYATCR